MAKSHLLKTFRAVCLAAFLPTISPTFASDTPKLNVRTAHGNPREEQRKEQIERQAREYNLKRYTLTRDIVVEEGVRNHSSPVLTLNLRFLDNDDRALSAYLHEQAHWVMMERHRRDIRDLYDDLKRLFPKLPVDWPEGDGAER